MFRCSRKTAVLRRCFFPKRSVQICANYDNMLNSYDVVIIGAGHNGLVSAAYLQKLGLQVCVLERRHVIGGAAVTEEIVPGFKFSRASYVLSLLRPDIIQELDLKRHGLKVHFRDPSSFTPIHPRLQHHSSRNGLLLSSSPEFNYESISAFSKHDALAFPKYNAWLEKIVSAVDVLFDNPPPQLNLLLQPNVPLSQKLEVVGSMKHLFKCGRILRKDIISFVELLVSPASKILNQWFEDDVLKATLATDAIIGECVSPHTQGSGYTLLHHCMGELNGVKGAWGYPEGGMGAVSNSICNAALSYGAHVYVNKSVTSILHDASGSVSGVLVNDGREIKSKIVLSNATPKVTFLDLLPKQSLPEKFVESVARINYHSPSVKVNVAISELPSFGREVRNRSVAEPFHRCTINMNCESMDIMHEAYLDSTLCKISERPMIDMCIPSSLDPSVAPPGKHVCLLFAQYFPKKSHESYRDEVANKVFEQVELYSPGFKQSIIDYEVLTPVELEDIFGLTGGSIFHGAMSLDQLYFFRPSWSSQSSPLHPVSPRTPLKGLYLCGSGAHPGGGVSGACGKIAAMEAFKDFKKSKE